MLLKFCALQIITGTIHGSFLAYITPYLSSEGYGAAIIGGTLALCSLATVLGQLLFSFISDKIRSIKKVYVACQGITLVAILLVYISSGSLKLFMVLVLSFAQMPMTVLLDTWVIKSYYNNPSKYAPIRASASFGYAGFSFIFGYYLEKIGFVLMPIAAIALVIILFFITTPTSEVPVVVRDKTRGINYEGLRNEPFIFMSIITLVMGLSCGTVINLLTYIIYNCGGNEGNLGTALALNALAQVPVMMYYPRLKGLGVYKKLLMAVGLYGSSFILMLCSYNLNMIYGSMLLYGFGFGILVPAIKEFVALEVEENLQTMGMTLLDIFQNGIGQGIGVFIGGVIIERYNTNLMLSLALMLVLVLVPGLIVLRSVKLRGINLRRFTVK